MQNEQKQEIQKKQDDSSAMITITTQSLSPFCKNLIDEWMSLYDDTQYLGCESNKIGDVVVALYHRNAIYLLGEQYKTIMYAPKLLLHFVDSQHIHIDDVLVKHRNVGNGSILMRALLQYATTKNVKVITGFLSPVDDDHKERRDSYYKKFNFDITPSSVVKYLSATPKINE